MTKPKDTAPPPAADAPVLADVLDQVAPGPHTDVASDDLVTQNQRLGRMAVEVRDRQRAITAELDRRAAAARAAYEQELQNLGALPPTQTLGLGS